MGLFSALAGPIISGVLGKRSGDKQAKTSQNNYLQQRSDLAPYRDAGVNALNQYQDAIGQTTPFQGGAPLPEYSNIGPYAEYQNTSAPPPEYGGSSDFQFDMANDPGAQYGIDQALKAVSRQHAGQGGYNSGNVLAALNDRAIGEANRYANDAFNRQMGESRENYGRGVTDYGIESARNRDLYGRDLTTYGLQADRNRDIYGRGVQDYGIESARNQDMYNRSLGEYNLGYNQNQNYLNRLNQLAGSGQNAAAATGAFGGANVANQLNAEQYGTGSINNAINQGFRNVTSNNQFDEMMDLWKQQA